MGIASLVLGILAVVTGIFLAPVGIVLGIVGIILGIVGIRRGEMKNVAIAGLVLSIVGLVIGVAMTLLIGLFAVNMMGDPELMNEIQQAGQQALEALESAAPSIAP